MLDLSIAALTLANVLGVVGVTLLLIRGREF